MTDFPKGITFLREVVELEERCTKETWKVLPQTGRQVPRCLTALGDLLSLTHQASGCLWGCTGPDHTANHLAGRVATLAPASLRCLSAGYYDESLALTRCVAELANLLVLFVREPVEFEQWKHANRKERTRRFSPVQVRLTSEERGFEPLIDQARYAALTEVGVHITPSTVPESHNPRRRAVLGQIFQLPGAIMALTELSIATAGAAHQASRLLQLSNGMQSEFDACTRNLIDALPGIDIMNIEQLLASLSDA